MSILIINQAGTDNLGDIAIGEVLMRELSAMDPIAIPFAPITAKVSGGVLSKILNMYRLDIRYARWIRNRLKAMDTPIEAVVIGGGELLTANMNFNAALKAWMNVFYKRNIPVYIWGVGGGHTNLLYRIRYKAALKKAKAICVRDKKAKGIVKKCYGREAVLYPDLVFTYGMNTPGVSKQNEHKTVLCNVLSYRQYINGRGTYTKDEYFTAWEELINKEITPNATIIFGSTTEEDRVTTKEFAEYIKNPASKIMFADTLEDYWEQLETVDCVISGRMHAMILAMQRGCSCVPFVWKDKLAVFKEEYVDSRVNIGHIQDRAAMGVAELKSLIAEG